jgi:hypothetical protein
VSRVSHVKPKKAMTQENITHLYRIEMLGLQFTDVDQSLEAANEFPLNTNHYDGIEQWVDGINEAVNQFDSIEPQNEDLTPYDLLVKRINHVEINIESFEANWDLDFNLERPEVQDAIPYEVDFNLTTIAEKFIEHVEP